MVHFADRPPPASQPAYPDSLHPFVLEVGRALSLAGTAVSETQDRLLTIAVANGAPDARVVVFPTALIVSLGTDRRATVESIPQRTGALRLDQISALYEVVKLAERGEIAPDDGLNRVVAIRSMKPRYRPAVTVFGYTMMTVGLCLMLKPSPLDVVMAAGFGALIAPLVLLTRGSHDLSVLTPLVAASFVSAITFGMVRLGIAEPGLAVLIAPLVTFLPGSALTTATVELASGEMVAGSSRLVFGSLRLLLPAFGIIAGTQLVSLPHPQALLGQHTDALGPWAPWLGVFVFGVAVAIYFSAPRGALPWIVLVVFVAWLGQLVGESIVSADVSGFFGALAMTPLAIAVSRLPSGPPSQVTFLPAFWLLVPGAIGLVGVTGLLGAPAAVDLPDLVRPVAAIVAIALGVLCGTTIYRAVASAPRYLRRRSPG